MKKNNVARHRFAGQSLSPLLPHGAGLLLLVLLVVAIVSLRQSTPVSNAATVSATSPHYSHINILDFGRAVRWLPYGSIRTEGYRWYAQHVDVMETQMDNATFSGGDTTSTYIKSLNPSIKTFGYDYDLTMCQHEHCDHTQPPHSLFTNLPEEYYLHFSQDTQVQFTDHLGNSMGSATITGCPAPQPITSACRVSIFIWNDNRWIVNLKSVAWQQWFADHLVNELTVNSLG